MAFLARLGAPVRGFLEFLGDQAHLVLRTLRSGLALRSGQLAVVGGQTRLQLRFTGLDAARLKYGITWGFFMESVRQALSNQDFAATLLKVFFISGAITFHACHFGLRVQRSQTEIPQAVARTVVSALVAVFVIDGLLAALFYF